MVAVGELARGGAAPAEEEAGGAALDPASAGGERPPRMAAVTGGLRGPVPGRAGRRWGRRAWDTWHVATRRERRRDFVRWARTCLAACGRNFRVSTAKFGRGAHIYR